MSQLVKVVSVGQWPWLCPWPWGAGEASPGPGCGPAPTPPRLPFQDEVNQIMETNLWLKQVSGRAPRCCPLVVAALLASFLWTGPGPSECWAWGPRCTPRLPPPKHCRAWSPKPRWDRPGLQAWPPALGWAKTTSFPPSGQKLLLKSESDAGVLVGWGGGGPQLRRRTKTSSPPCPPQGGPAETWTDNALAWPSPSTRLAGKPLQAPGKPGGPNAHAVPTRCPHGTRSPLRGSGPGLPASAPGTSWVPWVLSPKPSETSPAQPGCCVCLPPRLGDLVGKDVNS